jgi:2-keto-3-deoxy-L-rhamnonate aldolase RhmA
MAGPVDIGGARVRCARGERVLGTVVASGDLALAELLAGQFDFLWIDLEHSPLTIHDVQGLLIAARAGGAAAFVRVPDCDSALVQVLVDLGVDGVIAPRVEDVVAAQRFAASVRFPPLGSRGFAHRRFTAFGLAPEAALDGNLAPLCFIQIESVLAVERAEQLAQVAGVDGLVVGPADLALSVGVSQSLDSPELVDAIKTVQDAAAAAGIVSGLAAGDPTDVLLRALGERTSLLAYSADMRIYASAIENAVAKMASSWRNVGSPAAASEGSNAQKGDPVG